MPLLSARCIAKRLLGVGVAGASSKWSWVRRRAAAVVDRCMGVYDYAVSVVRSDPQRWSGMYGSPLVTVTSKQLTKAFHVANPYRKPTAACEWASAYHQQWHTAFPKPTVDECTSIGGVRAGSET